MILVPFPTERLASSALHALQVDDELSASVHRSLSLSSSSTLVNATSMSLSVVYEAKTNRMLRVAVNGFMESLGSILDVMEGLDLDVLDTQEA